jgi:hypothetical protein
MSPAAKAKSKSKTRSPGKQVVLAPSKQPTKPFSAKVTGVRIARHLAAADKAVNAYNRAGTTYDAEIMSVGTILADVAKNHPKEMKEVCKHAGLGHSRTEELLAVAHGRKTMDEVRADNAERQRRFKAKRKKAALSPPNPVTAKGNGDAGTATGKGGNNTDPTASAAVRRAANAAAEADDETDAEAADTETETETSEDDPAEETTTEPAEETADEAEPVAKATRSRSVAKPKPAIDASQKALGELKFAINNYVPQLSPNDRQAALDHMRNAVMLMDAKTSEVAA